MRWTKKAIELSTFNNVKVLKSSGSKLLVEVSYKSALDKEKLNMFLATFTVNLSCVSITYSGETAQIGFQIVAAGGLNLLLAILESFWCGSNNGGGNNSYA